MPPKKLTKKEARKEIENFFKDIKNKTQKEVKKTKNLAMSFNIPLKVKRKTFCKECLTPYSGTEKIRIKNGVKRIGCLGCGETSGWKINSS